MYKATIDIRKPVQHPPTESYGVTATEPGAKTSIFLCVPKMPNKNGCYGCEAYLCPMSEILEKSYYVGFSIKADNFNSVIEQAQLTAIKLMQAAIQKEMARFTKIQGIIADNIGLCDSQTDETTGLTEKD